MKNNLLNTIFNLKKNSLPKNVYAIRIKDKNGNLYDIAIQHDGYCPAIYSEREQSRFNDYLSNLENSVISEYFKSIKKRKPKNYSTQLEIVTDQQGKIYHFTQPK